MDDDDDNYAIFLKLCSEYNMDVGSDYCLNNVFMCILDFFHIVMDNTVPYNVVASYRLLLFFYFSFFYFCMLLFIVIRGE